MVSNTVLRTPSQFGSAFPPFLPSERQRGRGLPEAGGPGGELRIPLQPQPRAWRPPRGPGSAGPGPAAAQPRGGDGVSPALPVPARPAPPAPRST